MTTELKLGWQGWGKRKLSFFGNHFKELLPSPVNKRGTKDNIIKRTIWGFLFPTKGLKKEQQQKLSAIKRTINNNKWFFFPSSACRHLVSYKWPGMIFFSYQWHTPVAWRPHSGKGKICMAYLQQAASKPIRSKTCTWIPKVEMTDEHEEVAWPPPPSLNQTVNSRDPCSCDSPSHCLFSWAEQPLEVGVGVWALMLLYSSFINVNMEKDFDTSTFTCLYWNIFLVKVPCKFESIVCSPSFWFLFSV